MNREYKIVILGSGAVGKSSITVRFVQGIFVEKYDPNLEESYRTQYVVDEKDCVVEILDTAGYNGMRDLYTKHGHGFLLVFSIIAESTFAELPEIYEQILRVKDRDNVPLLLLGNKKDLWTERIVFSSKAQELAQRWNCEYIECSAKTGERIDEVFQKIIRAVDHDIKDSEKQKHTNNQKKESRNKKKPICIIL